MRSAGAHPRWSRPCAHCCALDSAAAWPRSWLRSTRGTARRRPAAPRRSCSCRRAHVTLHGTGGPRVHVQRPGVHAVCACQANRGLERNRAPLDAEDGVPVSASAVTAASGTASSAFLAPTAPRTAWQLANSASQLVTPDASSWGVIWAWQTTPNVASTTRIEAQDLQRSRDDSERVIVSPVICDEGQVQCEPKGAGSKAMASLRCAELRTG